MTGVDDFFAFARERHAIYLRRKAGVDRPWTSDPILAHYRFTNVFREYDRTTIWFRENARDPLRDRPEVLLATVLFRWFNRISTGEAIFCQQTLEDEPKTAWDHFLENGDTDTLRAAILTYCGRGPYVTGSYVILGRQGMSKLDGVLSCLGELYSGSWLFENSEPYVNQMMQWPDVAEFCLRHRGYVPLESVWSWLRHVPYLGDFMAYEIVTDLRHTALLDRAPDINTWANPGPGAARGLARVHSREISGRWLRSKPPKSQMIEEMRHLLRCSQDPRWWPQFTISGQHCVLSENWVGDFGPWMKDDWPPLELREIEHSLCEWDKYCRAKSGEGRPRGVYR